LFLVFKPIISFIEMNT